MKKTTVSPWIVAYLLLFLFSILLRFYQLHIPLLDDREAAIALKAATGDSGWAFSLSGDPGISSILSLLFSIFGKSEVIARVFSAIMGLVVVFIPFLFRKTLGKETSYILSILLMFDPGLIAFSRQVNGAILSISGLLLAFGFVINKKYIPAGIASGLALLGSSIVWPGFFALGLALWLSGFEKDRNSSVENDGDASVISLDWKSWKNGIVALVVTFLIAGSAFFTRPEGFTAPLVNLTSYFRGWVIGSNFPLGLFLLSFVLYQPVALILGVIEGIRGSRSRDRVSYFLLRWFILSVLLAVVYPSKGMDTLALSFVPLLALSARAIFRIWQSLEVPDVIAYGQMALVVLLIPFAWVNAIVLRFPIEGQDETLRLAALIGALFLLFISSVLIRFGWPPKQSETGIFLGLVFLIGIFTFSTAWRAAGLGKHPQAELWWYDGVSDELDLMTQTVGDFSEWNRISRTGIDVVVVNYPSPAILWALRDFTDVKQDHYLPVSSNPAIVITAAEDIPALAESYRGQDIVLTRKTAWSLILPEEWIKWYAFRELPVEKQQVILWARTDLFPGESNQSPAIINQPQ